MAFSRQDILNSIHDGLADLQDQETPKRQKKEIDYDSYGPAPNDPPLQDLTQTSPAGKPPLSVLTLSTNAVHSSLPPTTMLQVQLIEAIKQYRSQSEYYAARQAREIGYQIIGQDKFDQALDVAGIKAVPRQNKTKLSANFTALGTMFIVWEEVLCLANAEDMASVKRMIEDVHGEDVLMEKEKMWVSGAKNAV